MISRFKCKIYHFIIFEHRFLKKNMIWRYLDVSYETKRLYKCNALKLEKKQMCKKALRSFFIILLKMFTFAVIISKACSYVEIEVRFE